MAAKVQIKNDSIYNFGGFYFCIDYFRKSGLAELIDNTLGIRGVLATYSYSEIVESMMQIFMTGGARIEDAKRLSAQFSEKTAHWRSSVLGHAANHRNPEGSKYAIPSLCTDDNLTISHLHKATSINCPEEAINRSPP